MEKGPLLLPTSRGGRPFLAQDRQHASFIHTVPLLTVYSNSTGETIFVSLFWTKFKRTFNFLCALATTLLMWPNRFMIFESGFEPIELRYKLGTQPSTLTTHPST